MKITVFRDRLTSNATTGKLLIDGVFECYTLEDYVRQEEAPKIFGKTAIPYGEYDVVITHSPHFGYDLPLLCSVPNFEGVRIHSGNTATDTEGCLLVGVERGYEAVYQSRAAFKALFSKIKDALDKGDDVTIEYLEGA